jgi:hypothetical protein
MDYPTNPTEPATDHRADPRWQEAQAAYVADMTDDESPDDAYVRHVKAAFVMWRVAKEHTTTSGPVTRCPYCEQPEPECSDLFGHRRLHGTSEISVWRLAMAGESDAFGRAKAARQAVSS